jgi:hypothetical protein
VWYRRARDFLETEQHWIQISILFRCCKFKQLT